MLLETAVGSCRQPKVKIFEKSTISDNLYEFLIYPLVSPGFLFFIGLVHFRSRRVSSGAEVESDFRL